MATVNYKCPNCGAPLKFNPDNQKFSCEFCMSDFDEQEVQRIYAEREAKKSQAEQKEQKQAERQNEHKTQDTDASAQEEAVIYTCPSCGAEVVTTASTAATTCFYCQNPVVLGGRLSGKFAPDRVIPFFISKDKAVETFLQFCRKKWFLPKLFASKKQVEKISGVYFPYWYVDEKKQASMTARGEKIRVWRTGRKEYTETSVYRLERSGSIDINNVFESALKSEDRKMLRGVHPFDLSKAKPFAMSFLSGFQAEKRDVEKQDINEMMQDRINGYCVQVLKNTMSEYTSVVTENYNSSTDCETWNYTLLPVWILTYKYKGKIYPYAINGQTGKTYGELPVSKGKLALLFAIVAAVLLLLLCLGGLLL